MNQKMRSLRNLLFVIVFFVALLSLSTFSGKAVKDVKQNQIRQELVEVKKLNPNVKQIQLGKKLLIF